MKELGNKIAQKRKDLGMTQSEFADRLHVTRQSVSRWEAGTVLPDIDKIPEIASLLQVSCDLLLRDDFLSEEKSRDVSLSPLLQSVKGKKVRISFFDGEADPDLFNKVCEVLDFEGNWMKVEYQGNRGTVEKLIPLSSILSLEKQEEE